MNYIIILKKILGFLMGLNSAQKENLYELVFIVRQDSSSQDIDKLGENLGKIISVHGGKVIKKEYWGLRTLAYLIKKNHKGHYVLLGFKADPVCIKELERKIKLDENIIRHAIVRVEKIDQEPSPILKSFEASSTPVVNVTTDAN